MIRANKFNPAFLPFPPLSLIFLLRLRIFRDRSSTSNFVLSKVCAFDGHFKNFRNCKRILYYIRSNASRLIKARTAPAVVGPK